MSTIAEINRNELLIAPEPAGKCLTAAGSSLPAGTMPPSLRRNRLAVGLLFFLHGLCFASWASRIPTIQEDLHLTASALGAVLFALPAGFFVS
ncbi:hypothetical protein KK078_28730, partial [Fulvivirgaceae bacterium PWU37]|nr:hypothetical protein [Dawidia soli]